MPKDWAMIYVKDIAQIKTGSRNTQDRQENGLYPFFVRSQVIERINSYSFDGEAVLTAGDGVGVGKVFHYIKGKFDCHQRVYRISNFENHVNGFYFFKYFQANFYKRIMQMTAKSSVDSIRMEMISEMEIPIPLLSEQMAIAEMLNDADQWIAQLEKLVAKKRGIKLAVMQKLLQPKESWQYITFDEAFRFLSTASFSRADLTTDDEVGYIHYGDIHTRWNYYLDLTKEELPSIPAEKLKYPQFLKDGDLIMADASEDYSGIGKSIEVKNLAGKKAIAGLHTFLLRDKDANFAPGFKGYIAHISSVKSQFDSLATGLKVFSLSKGALRNVQIPHPSFDEQVSITAILVDMEDEIEKLEKKLDKARKIKNGMIEQLLTGQIRLGIKTTS